MFRWRLLCYDEVTGESTYCVSTGVTLDSPKSLSTALSAVTSEVIDSFCYKVLDGNQRPWIGSGIHVTRGQAYSMVGSGQINWSKSNPQLHAGPGFHLWSRVFPGGRIVNVTRVSGSFIADCDGEIQLGIYLGMWRDEYGALDTPDSAFSRLSGALEVCLMSWRCAALEALDELAGQINSTLLETERERLQTTALAPAGWNYLFEIGTSDVFRDCGARPPRICLDASNDQAIIRKAVDFPLSPTTRLNWRWRLLEHPSVAAEDTPRTHDYISLAAEFDNGRDLTWIWSTSLPTETWFACPIKAWQPRETHYVVRSGTQLGDKAIAEERHVYADVAKSMGPPPARIVAIWLIAVASFQHGTARAEFEEIRLSDNEQVLRVL